MTDQERPRSLDDVMDDLDAIGGKARRVYTGLDTSDEEPETATPAETQPETPPEAPEGEPAPDTAPEPPVEEPTEDSPPAPPAEPEPEPEPATASAPEEEIDDLIVETDHGPVRYRDLTDPAKREELRLGYLRQKAFTEKTMALAEQRRALEAENAKRVQVTKAILANEDAREFVDKHGDLAWNAFMTDLDSALEVLRDPAKMQRLWRQTEALAENPELQRQLIDSRQQQAAAQQLQDYQEREELQLLSKTIDETIIEFGAQYPNVNPDDVAHSLVRLAGLDPAKLPNLPESDQRTALRILQGFMEVRVPDGTGNVARYLRESVIRNQFELLNKYAKPQQPQPNGKAAAPAPVGDVPPAPVAGEPGAPPEVAPEKPASFQDVLDDLEHIQARASRVARR